jgi:cell wall-associated NlpC family hydrolase
VRYAYYQTTGLDALDGYTWQQWTQALSLHPNTVVDAGAAGKSSQVDNYLSTLKPGDILFYGTNANQHVAVYLGSGKQMNAYQSGVPDGVTGVTTDDVFWGAVRLW